MAGYILWNLIPEIEHGRIEGYFSSSSFFFFNLLEGFLFFSGCDCWEDLEDQGLRKEDPGIKKMEPPRGFLASLWNFICFLPYFIGLLILGLIKGLYSFLTVFNCVFFFRFFNGELLFKVSFLGDFCEYFTI